MPSGYTKNLGIEQPATGEQAGVWGVTANTSYATFDTSIAGNIQLSLATSNYTLSTGQGGAAQNGSYPLIVWTGAQASTVTIAPDTGQHLYIMRNQASGAITFTQGTGGQFVLQPGYDAQIYSDGAGANASVAAVANPQFVNMLVTGRQIVRGGGGGLTLDTGAWLTWWSLDNQGSFDVNAVALASGGYALRFGVANFTTVGLAMDNTGRVGIGTVTPSTLLDVRPPGSMIQLSNTLSAMVSGNNNGGAIYFGSDTGGNNPLVATGAIETSWGGATNPMIAIGVVRDGLKANILMDYHGNTHIRNGSTDLFTFGVLSAWLGGALTVDGNNNRSGVIDLNFGGGGEGIGSTRVQGLNLNGLTFYTANAPRLYLTNDGRVGIQVFPDQMLTVNGIIQSLAGGFQFPDGTVQTTAAITTNLRGLYCPPSTDRPVLSPNTLAFSYNEAAQRLTLWLRKLDGTTWTADLSLVLSSL